VLRVPVSSDAALGAVVRHLGEARIAVTELSLSLPSLDSVFFRLTGRTSDDPGDAPGIGDGTGIDVVTRTEEAVA
jgi:oleandomycin transport system ATP-binding protein